MSDTILRIVLRDAATTPFEFPVRSPSDGKSLCKHLLCNGVEFMSYANGGTANEEKWLTIPASNIAYMLTVRTRETA